MAAGLVRLVEAHRERYLGAYIPPDADEYEYWLDGKDPTIQFFHVDPNMEMKMKPNHSDYLQWRESKAQTNKRKEDSVLDILYQAFMEEA